MQKSTIIKYILASFETVVVALFILSFSLAVPILARSYYYWNVDLLQIEKATGYDKETIIDAYDSVMDYLTGNAPFSTGSLPHSAEGKAHFEDCKKLFTTDFIILGITSFILLSLFVLKKTNVIKTRFLRFSPFFSGSSTLLGVLAILGIWGVSDFNSLFNAFHKVFFPGKTNWVFSIYKDPIVNILPQELWINFAILIIAIVLAFFVFSFVLKALKNKNIPRILPYLIQSETYKYK